MPVSWGSSSGHMLNYGNGYPNYESPLQGGECTLTVSAKGECYATLCTILEPEKFHCERVTKIDFGLDANEAGGVGMLLELHIAPRTVSFEGAARAALYKKPKSMEGWEMLSDVLLKHRKAASEAESAMLKLDMNDRSQHSQHRRLELFKKEMEAFEGVRFKQIGRTYEAIRHRLTPEQRASIVSRIKAVLGSLPDDMKCDLPTSEGASAR